MSVTDELLRSAEDRISDHAHAELDAIPRRRVAVVTCMDPRIDPAALLGLSPGDVHVLRNAGGVVTDDTIRSLAISQRKLGTEEVVLIHHTDCELQELDDDTFRDQIRRETGIKPSWSAEAFHDLDADVRQSIARVEASPFLSQTALVRGFVLDVRSGRLREIS
ncbi:carbonic anhydrase [Conexibacter sp. JD483]|uniref:beta-class carbonic anhydrase n=1 Tax=unclassified Conexibacter TaxID=2627773 RepID=UPI00271EDBF6|nr:MULTISPECIES: carbonic anhydrase [unclassified Conexibacter]MDO8187642.1 carbonic anhydrase [Conexibacter sp. CPCC 205706]MDO8201026.1 carbonic anhydrase [Conexibacter sp. CPCC 205762]MDR9371199.1 carbonic anhydrase [Conexibacter sp. JD483]